jgi:protein-tyrosine phosphatase
LNKIAMTTEVYWIEGPWPGRLAISPRPRGGDWLEDEIRAWSISGVDVVVSLLTLDETRNLGLTEESQLCRSFNISFISFPIEDRMVPTSHDDAVNLVSVVERLLFEGHSVVIHCRGGIGRSGLLAASLLVTAGLVPEEAMRRVSAARGISVPETDEQIQWVKDFVGMTTTLTH